MRTLDDLELDIWTISLKESHIMPTLEYPMFMLPRRLNYYTRQCPRDIYGYETDYQQSILLQFFQTNMYPTKQHLVSIARLTNLPHKSIKLWFQNRRRMYRETLYVQTFNKVQ